jgi:hypothetical protein
MTETASVYVYSVSRASPFGGFRGCGALIEGNYIATCRHVWKAAQSGEPPQVEIVFPFGVKERADHGNKLVTPARIARLADACGDFEDPTGLISFC